MFNVIINSFSVFNVRNYSHRYDGTNQLCVFVFVLQWTNDSSSSSFVLLSFFLFKSISSMYFGTRYSSGRKKEKKNYLSHMQTFRVVKCGLNKHSHYHMGAIFRHWISFKKTQHDNVCIKILSRWFYIREKERYKMWTMAQSLGNIYT